MDEDEDFFAPAVFSRPATSITAPEPARDWSMSERARCAYMEVKTMPAAATVAARAPARQDAPGLRLGTGGTRLVPVVVRVPRSGPGAVSVYEEEELAAMAL